MIKNCGGIDVQILGIGTNGHIFFNEPHSSRYSSTRVVDLTENTIKDNSRFFNDLKDVPTHVHDGFIKYHGPRNLLQFSGNT